MADLRSDERKTMTAGGMYCAAKWCPHNSHDRHHSFFRFPRDERKAAWIAYARRPEYHQLPESALRNKRLCDVHFTPESFTSRARIRLKKIACPTIPPLCEQAQPSTSMHAAAPASLAPVEGLESSAPDPQSSGSTHSGSPSLMPNRGAGEPHPQPAGSTRLGSPPLTRGTGTNAPEADEAGTSHLQSPQLVPSLERSAPAPDHTETTPVTPRLHMSAPDPEPSCSTHAGSQPLLNVTPQCRKRGRPRTVRTPRTAALIHSLRTTRDKLRKRLFHAERRATTKLSSLSRVQIIQSASQYLSKEALEIFRVQLYLQPLRKFGRRWPPYFRGFALRLHSMGPKAYRYLSNLLTLPTVRSLRAWLRDMIVDPGVLSPVLEKLEMKLKDLPRRDRTCVLMFDEMSIKEHLQYDRGSDMVFGFADSGLERFPELANSALYVMLSGISNPWVQPLSYILSRSTASADTLEALLVELIQRLQSGNIFVKAVVCDQGASNRALAKNLQVTPSKPYFCIGDTKVYFIFDPPHLMKTTRNLLLKYDLLSGSTENKVQWSFIKQFYECNHPLKVRLAPKLTDSHINPTVFSRMTVKLATQVFSDSVSTGIAALIAMGQMPPAAAATSDFLQEMDVLFDTLNSSSAEQGDDKKMRYAMSASTDHKVILQSAVERIRNWKFVDCAREPPTITGWQVTINAVLALWDDLHENFEFTHLLTRRLNQDPLENMFGQFRQMHGDNETPNAFQFVAGLKRILASKLVEVSGKGNCESTEVDLLLNELKRMPVSTAASIQHEETVPECALAPDDESDTPPPSLVELNAQFAYAGSLVDSFLKASKCNSCANLLRATQEDLQTPSGVFHYLSDQAHTGAPSSAFFACYQNLEGTFQRMVGDILHKKNVKAHLVQAFQSPECEPFCSPDCKTRFLSLFAILRIEYYLRVRNAANRQSSAEKSQKRKRKKL